MINFNTITVYGVKMYYSYYYVIYRPDGEDQSSNVKYLMIILGLVTTVVIILISFLVYIVTGRPGHRSNKFAVLDNKGEDQNHNDRILSFNETRLG